MSDWCQRKLAKFELTKCQSLKQHEKRQVVPEPTINILIVFGVLKTHLCMFCVVYAG